MSQLASLKGSKAWVNQQIPFCDRGLFVDDSTDHLRSTRMLVPEIECILFNTGIPTHLLKLISDWVNSGINDPLHQ